MVVLNGPQNPWDPPVSTHKHTLYQALDVGLGIETQALYLYSKHLAN